MFGKVFVVFADMGNRKIAQNSALSISNFLFIVVIVISILVKTFSQSLAKIL